MDLCVNTTHTHTTHHSGICGSKTVPEDRLRKMFDPRWNGGDFDPRKSQNIELCCSNYQKKWSVNIVVLVDSSVCNCNVFPSDKSKSKTIEPVSPNLVHIYNLRHSSPRLILAQRGQRSRSHVSKIYSHGVTALYLHSLDDSTICC